MYAIKIAKDWVEFDGRTLPLDGAGSYYVPGAWSDEEKERRFGVFLVAEDVVPDDNRIVSETLMDDKGRPRLARNYEALAPVRLMVLKSIVQGRIIERGKMAQAMAMLDANPVYFARWFAPDRPEVYCDDPDAVGLVVSLGLDPAVILAP